MRLDGPPGEIAVGVPWEVGFVVRAHDVTPIEGVEPIVVARHRATGAEVRAEAAPEGPIGHYVATLTFPRAGEWKWSVEPRPYPATLLEPLAVVAEPDGATRLPARAFAAQLRRGPCDETGEPVMPLMDVGTLVPAAGTTGLYESPAPLGALGSSESVVAAKLHELLAGDYVVAVEDRATKSLGFACGEIAGRASDQRLAVGLRPQRAPELLGVALFEEDGTMTRVRVYLIDPAAAALPVEAPVAAVPGAAGGAGEPVIAITEDWQFSPAVVTVPVGGAVTWINRSAAAHTVAGDALAFPDSGPIEPGGAVTRVFDEPGRYSYRCGPHPFMVGEIVVE